MDDGTTLAVHALLLLGGILGITVRDVRRRPPEEGVLAAIKTPSVAKGLLAIAFIVLYAIYELTTPADQRRTTTGDPPARRRAADDHGHVATR